MASLREGTVLGDRFEIVGALGRGGTATVYLADDRLRGVRIALKVLHPHLSDDASMRARLRREVRAAAVLKHDAALVVHDLHELDGHLALSMPFHPGQTLAEHVAANGPMSPDALRRFGIQIAEALAAAHRQGVLHRDVTPNNILIGADGAAMLTDFGLARFRDQGSRSTGMLGTTGYAAPEVYSGERSDPRSDLYGLGAVLYLAATGRAPFTADNPMGTLQRQLSEDCEAIATVRPEIPADIAGVVQALLRRDPALRPQGARETADALQGFPLELGQPAPVERRRGPLRYLPGGTWTVVVKEKDEDKWRRDALRVDSRQQRASVGTDLRKLAVQLVDGVRGALGMPGSGEAATPEELLATAVAREAGLPDEALMVPPPIYQRRFRLVDGVSRQAAAQLVAASKVAGFGARAYNDPLSVVDNSRWLNLAMAPVIAMVVAIVMAVGLAFGSSLVGYAIGAAALVPIVGIAVLGALALSGALTPGPPAGLATAYTQDLSRFLAPGHEHLRPARDEGAAIEAHTADEPVPHQQPTPLSRGQQLVQRAEVRLDALEVAIATHGQDLPEIALHDLRDTLRDLREAAQQLGDEVDHLEQAIAQGSGDDSSWVASRLHRLETMERAGDPVDRAELAQLRSALAEHQANLDAADRLESQLTTCLAQLLEIASTASRVRRELLAEPEPARSAERLVERLRAETRAADEARREAARRAGQRNRTRQ